MKVLYPGPAVSYKRSSYFTAYGIVLNPGVNEINDEVGQKLLDAQIVKLYEDELTFEYEGPISTEDEATKPSKPPEEEDEEEDEEDKEG